MTSSPPPLSLTTSHNKQTLIYVNTPSLFAIFNGRFHHILSRRSPTTVASKIEFRYAQHETPAWWFYLSSFTCLRHKTVIQNRWWSGIQPQYSHIKIQIHISHSGCASVGHPTLRHDGFDRFASFELVDFEVCRVACANHCESFSFFAQSLLVLSQDFECPLYHIHPTIHTTKLPVVTKHCVLQKK